jgi:hypothetical protein
MNTLALTADQIGALMDEARAEIVASILAKHADSLTLVSKAQAAGLLDLDTKTLDSLPIPRVVIVPKKKIAYRLTDIAKFIGDNIEH